MDATDVIRAWKDPVYRSGLQLGELERLPPNPAGTLEPVISEDAAGGGDFDIMQTGTCWTAGCCWGATCGAYCSVSCALTCPYETCLPTHIYHCSTQFPECTTYEDGCVYNK